MKRPHIIPLMATSVVMLGAAAVVANPVDSPPADIRISASDLDATGKPLDVLDPGFLDSLNAIQTNPTGVIKTDWPTPDSQRILSFGIDDTAQVGYNSVVDGLLNATATNPLLFIGVLALDSPVEPQGVPPAPGEVLSPDEMLSTLVSVSTGFGDAGATFVKQAGLLPEVINDLAGQVSAGTMAPDVALRRLLTVPLSVGVGIPELTGNPGIDAVFSNGLLKAIIDVLVANAPTELGGGTDGVIDTIGGAVTDALTDARDATDPSATQTSTDAMAATTTADTDATEKTSKETVTKTDTTVQTGGDSNTVSTPSRTAADVAKQIRDRIKQTLNDLGKPGNNDKDQPKPSGPPSPPGSAGGQGTPGGGSSTGGAGAPGGAPGN